MTDDPDRLEVTFDDDDDANADEFDLSRDDFTAAKASAPDALVITDDDLLDVDEPQAFPGFASGTPPMMYPGQPAGMYPMAKGKGGVAESLRSTFWQATLAGFAGGFLGWAISETFVDSVNTPREPVIIAYILLGLFGAVISALIGASLGSVDGVLSGVYQKALISGLICFGIGFGGGFIGGMLAQVVFGALINLSGGNLFTIILARIIGWAIIGGLVGLGPGIAIRSGRKVLNGLIGGLIGGAVGGALFDVIGNMIPYRDGMISRAIAITVMGGCIGMAIAMVEKMAKQAWLRVTGGMMTGKEFILYHASTTVGNSPKCEITILKDPGIEPQHFCIQAIPGGYELQTMMGQVYVNGQPVQRTRLRDNDQIQIGSTVFTYSERAAKAAMPMDQPY